MDTSHLANIAEDLISHSLQRAGMLVAKPKFDLAGTDLLAFAEMKDGVKFCRIQCKGRSLVNGSSSIKIPKAHVTDGLVAILYAELGDSAQHLFCFFANDIRQWHQTDADEYSLSLSRTTIEQKLEFYRFDDTKVHLIQAIVASAELHGEFRSLIYGRAAMTLGAVVVKGEGTVRPPDAT